MDPPAVRPRISLRRCTCCVGLAFRRRSDTRLGRFDLRRDALTDTMAAYVLYAFPTARCSLLMLALHVVIEADNSTALGLLLRYPVPELPQSPQTFVEDAIYLRQNLNVDG